MGWVIDCDAPQCTPPAALHYRCERTLPLIDSSGVARLFCVHNDKDGVYYFITWPPPEDVIK